MHRARREVARIAAASGSRGRSFARHAQAGRRHLNTAHGLGVPHRLQCSSRTCGRQGHNEGQIPCDSTQLRRSSETITGTSQPRPATGTISQTCHRDHISRAAPSARQVWCDYAPREYGARTKWQRVNTMRKLIGVQAEHDWWQCVSWMDNARELGMQDKVPDMCARRGLGLSILCRLSYQGSCPHSVACMGMTSDRLVVALWEGGETRVGREGTQWPGGSAVVNSES